jgi:GT2 family glycosyltransferase
MDPKKILKLRSLLLSPNSKLELWLRTQYHQLNKTRLFFKIQDCLARHSYQQWKNEQTKKLSCETTSTESKVTFVVYCSTNPFSDLNKTLDSILNLQGDNWEVLLTMSQKIINEVLPKEMGHDECFIIPPSTTSNLLQNISGDYVLFCQAGDQFSPTLLDQFNQKLDDENPVDCLYYDCEYVDPKSNKIQPLFKPSKLSPALLLSVNILSRGLIRREFITENLSSIMRDGDIESLEYHLSLLLCEKDGNVQHIPQVMIKQTGLVTPDTAKNVDVVCNNLRRSGLENVAPIQKAHGVRFTWQTGTPSVAIIIPTRNNQNLLETCLASLLTNTAYKNFKIHLVDNSSDDLGTLEYYHQLQSTQTVEIHPYQEEFNYSYANNLGVAQSKSDLILFLNDDMEIFDPDWLTELVQWAIRPDIGVVGTKLIRANHIIQHAGIIIGLVGFAGHIYLNAPEHYQGLFGSVDWYREYMAVTGACQMVRRDIFNQVGGYDEGYQVAFGDIDFCLRVHQMGYRNIYTPYASLFHYEGRSRGYDTPQADILRAFQQMESTLSAEDPYFSPNLTYTRIPKCKHNIRDEGEQEKLMQIRKAFYKK